MTPTAGISFKADYLEDALNAPAADLWFEVHAENYMVAGVFGSRCSPLFARLGRYRFTASAFPSRAPQIPIPGICGVCAL
jgi:hypothetical protein